MMRIRPNKDGSRSVRIDTPHLLLNATVNADGSVDIHSVEVREPSAGLGDTIAKATKAIGIKPCGGCKKRQAKLNKLIPYKDAP